MGTEKNNIDDFSRKLLEERSFEYNPEAWENAQAMLEERMPVRKSGRYWKVMFVVFAGALLLGWAYWVSQSSSNESTEVKQSLSAENFSSTDSKVRKHIEENNAGNLVHPFVSENQQNTANTAVQKEIIPRTTIPSLSNQTHTSNQKQSKQENEKPMVSSRHSTMDNDSNVATALAPKNDNQMAEAGILNVESKPEGISSIDNTDGKNAQLEDFSQTYLALDFLQTKGFVSANEVENLILPVKPKPQKSKSLKPRFSLGLYAGFDHYFFSLKSTDQSHTDYINRRNSEETNRIGQSYGMEGILEKGNWRFGLGLRWSQMERQATYSNHFFRDSIFQTIETTIDSTVIQPPRIVYRDGVPQTFYWVIYDTITTVGEDTITNVVSISETQTLRQTLRQSYIEMPFTVGYTFGKRRWGLGLSAGLSAGLLTSTGGMALNANQNGLIAHGGQNELRNFIFKGIAIAEVRYRVSSSTKLALRVSGQYFLNDLFNTNAATSAKPFGVGLHLGLERRF